jgi:hypothetical protein
MTDFPLVYRANEPAGFKGRACRLAQLNRPQRGVVYAGCDNVVVFEFANGETVTRERFCAVSNRSLSARQAIGKRAAL